MHGHEPHFSDTIIFWINFAVFLTALYLLTRKVIAAAWTDRRVLLVNAIDGARKQLIASQSMLSEAESRYMQLESKIQQIKETYQSETDKEGSELIESAKKTAATIISKAKSSIESELRVSLKNLQKTALDNAFQKAASIMKSSADSNLNDKLVDKTIGDSVKFKVLH